MALIATVAVLALGLLIASAKSSFDTESAEVRQNGRDIVLLDRMLGYYGDDAKEIRDLLRDTVGVLANRVWRQGASRSGAMFLILELDRPFGGTDADLE